MKLSYNTIDHDGRVWVLLEGHRLAKEGWPVFLFSCNHSALSGTKYSTDGNVCWDPPKVRRPAMDWGWLAGFLFLLQPLDLSGYVI